MSWSVSAIGKPAAVASKVAADLSSYKCVEPEETIKQTAGQALIAAINAQDPDSVIQVTASGQSGTAPKLNNTLNVSITPIYGFIE
jgi:hypothetical protein